jgi:hypothetical protein
MRIVLILAALTGCGTSSSPHDLVDCVGWTNGSAVFVGQCERACEMPPADTGPLCDAVTIGMCHSFLDENGVAGCCQAQAVELPIRFYECGGQ